MVFQWTYSVLELERLSQSNPALGVRSESPAWRGSVAPCVGSPRTTRGSRRSRPSRFWKRKKGAKAGCEIRAYEPQRQCRARTEAALDDTSSAGGERRLVLEGR